MVPGQRRGNFVGYAPGVFDMFHVGHLNILRRAGLLCDYLIAGVLTDTRALDRKGRWPTVPEQERLEIVASMRFVDEAILETQADRLAVWEAVRFDAIYKGDDWKGTEKGRQLEQQLEPVGVKVIYLPYTQHTSTTLLRAAVNRAEST